MARSAPLLPAFPEPTAETGPLHLANDKGNFLALNWIPLISVALWQRVHHYAPALGSGFSPDRRAAVRRAIAAVDNTPIKDFASVPHHAIALPGGACGTATSETQVPSGGAHALGWTVLPAYQDLLDLARAITLCAPLGPGAASALESVAHKWNKTLSFLENKQLFFASTEQPEDLLGRDGVAVFVPEAISGGRKRPGGFYGTDGRIGTILGARLFATASAARRSIQQKGFAHPILVTVQLGLTGCVDPTQLDTAGADLLAAAIAANERRQLTDALEHASIEQLKERLARYEAAHPDTAPTAAAPSPRRRAL